MPSPNPSQGEVPEEAIEAIARILHEEDRSFSEPPAPGDLSRKRWRAPAERYAQAALPAIRSQIDQQWEVRLEEQRLADLDRIVRAQIAASDLRIELQTAESAQHKAEERLEVIERQREEDAIELASRSAEAVADAQRAQRKAEAALAQRVSAPLRWMEAFIKRAQRDLAEQEKTYGLKGRTGHRIEVEGDVYALLLSEVRCALAEPGYVHRALTQQPSSTSPQQEVEADDDLGKALEMLTKQRLAIVEHVEQLQEFVAHLRDTAEKWQRERAKTRQAEKDDHASGKLPKDHTYEATWNYYEGLAKAYELAAQEAEQRLLTQPPADPEVGEEGPGPFEAAAALGIEGSEIPGDPQNRAFGLEEWLRIFAYRLEHGAVLKGTDPTLLSIHLRAAADRIDCQSTPELLGRLRKYCEEQIGEWDRVRRTSDDKSEGDLADGAVAAFNDVLAHFGLLGSSPTQPVSESPGNSGEPFEDDELDDALGKGWRRAVAAAFLNLPPTSRESVLRDLGCDSLQQVRARNLVAALAAKLEALPKPVPGNSGGVEEAKEGAEELAQLCRELQQIAETGTLPADHGEDLAVGILGWAQGWLMTLQGATLTFAASTQPPSPQAEVQEGCGCNLGGPCELDHGRGGQR